VDQSDFSHFPSEIIPSSTVPSSSSSVLVIVPDNIHLLVHLHATVQCRNATITHSLSLESRDSLELSLYIVIDGFETLEDLLSLCDDLLVLQECSVVFEIDVDFGLFELSVGDSCS